MNIKTSAPELRKEDLEALAVRLGGKLPEAFIGFWLRYNGGTPEEDLMIDLDQGPWKEVIFARFRSYYPDGDGYGIEQILENKGDTFPPGAVPIASDPGGNYFLLLARHGGTIHFWDHEHEPEDQLEKPEDYTNLYFVATDFNSFLEMLHPSI